MNKETISDIYESIFKRLELSKEHRSGLMDRGLSDAEINLMGYRSWPMRRKHVVAGIIAEYEDVEGVPGFFKGGKDEWNLSGAVGLAIPVLNKLGRVVAIKIRPDKPINPMNKYTHLSSNPKQEKDGSQKYPAGTSASISCHWPKRIKDNKDILKIRITEGELKADIASVMSDIYTISMPGVGLWREALKEIESMTPKPVVHLAYDSDKNKMHHPEYGKEQGAGGDKAVAKSLIEFHQELALKGYKIVVEDWAEQEGKGIDDVLAAGGEDKIRQLTPKQVQEFVRDHSPALPTPSLGWLYVIGIKRFLNLATRREYDKEQYNDMFCHLTGTKQPADLALRAMDFEKVDLPTFWPNRELTFEEKGITYYNGWVENKLEKRSGEVSKFLKHIEYLVPEESERDILLDWMAYNVQNEGKKIHWAMLLQGVQGTGKSYLGYVMREMLGDSNVSTPSNEQIHEPYTEWQANASLIVIEEMMAQGRLSLMNKLKPMITESKAIIRPMWKPNYEQDNRFNMLMFTNHEDAIIIDDTDRRYCVIFSPAVPMKRKDYYKELWEWTDDNIEDLFGWMHKRDLTGFQPKGHAPMTGGKQELIKSSKLPLKDWVDTNIELESWPFQGDIVTTQHLVACLPSYLKNVTPQMLGRVLKQNGSVQLKQINMDGVRIRPWAVRRVETWECSGGAAISQEYMKWGSSAEPGGNPLLEAKPV